MKKKSIIYSVISFIVIGFSGCNWLDVEPESSFTDDKYWQTEAHFSAFNVGLHSLIRDYSYNYFLLGEPRANLYNEVTPFGGEATQGVERLTYNTLNKENPGVSNFANLYRPINQLNLMIDKTLATDLLSETDRNYYLGQAYGLRAYLYFHLLRSWGDVVLHLHGTDGADLDFYNLSKAASPATEVLAQIKEDIKSSETAFGNDISFKQGRHYWSLPATLMLKGEVYLWSGKQMGGGASDYQTAKSALEKVQTADVALLEDFESVFAYTNKNNKEIIYTIYNEKDEYELLGGSYSGNLLPQDSYMNLYYREDGTSFAAEPAAEKLRGIIRFQINPDMYQKGYHDSDLRKRATLKAVYAKNEDGEFTYVAPYANKFKGTLVDGGSSASLLNDYPVYRYADALLMLAMAKALLNEDPGTEIDLVRERAYGREYFSANRSTLAYPNDVDAAFYTDNKYGAPDTDPVEAVLKERLRELILEGKRWYDLRLVGDPYIYKYSLANETRLLWPINEDALTNNPALEQTEGY